MPVRVPGHVQRHRSHLTSRLSLAASLTTYSAGSGRDVRPAAWGDLRPQRGRRPGRRSCRTGPGVDARLTSVCRHHQGPRKARCVLPRYPTITNQASPHDARPAERLDPDGYGYLGACAPCARRSLARRTAVLIPYAHRPQQITTPMATRMMPHTGIASHLPPQARRPGTRVRH